MVKIETLFNERKISRISEIEITRYISFFENSYKDNLRHSMENLTKFPRWSIVSGYYAMHDITKLLLAKKFRIKVEYEIHATTIKVLRELIRSKEIINLIQKGYGEFLNLANDLEIAKKERVKVQYYTGTEFMHKEYQKRSIDFHKDIVLKYLNKIGELL